MNAARRFWILQFFSLFLGGLPFLVVPELVVEFTTVPQPGGVTPIEVDQVRMVGGASMGASFATLLACSRQVLAWQRGMAAIFIVFFLDWSTTLLMNQQQGWYRDYVPYGTLWIGYIYAFINTLILLQPGRNEPVPRTRIDRVPRRLRILWALQGIYYLGEAAICLLAAEWTLRWVTNIGDSQVTGMAIQQVRIVSAWTVCLALVSLYASLENRIRDWRQYRWVFLVSLLLRAVAVGLTVRSGYFEFYAGLTIAVPAVAFALLGFYWTLGHPPEAFRVERSLRPMQNADSDAPRPKAPAARVVWFWIFQTALFAVVGGLCILWPHTLLDSLLAAEKVPAYVVDATQIKGALLGALAVFNVLAIMTSQTVYRRRFAIVFVVYLAMTAVLLWLGMANQLYAPQMIVVSVVLSLLALQNLRWAIQRPPGAMIQADAGIAGSKPAPIFIAWLIQFVLLTTAGLALLFATKPVLLELSGGRYEPPEAFSSAELLVHGHWQLAGILCITLAVMTVFAMQSQREHVWRAFAFFGTIAFTLVAAVMVYVAAKDRYDEDALLVFAGAVGLALLNRWIRRRRGTWVTEDTNHEFDSWTLLDLVAGPLMALSVLLTKRRSSHLVGAGARGVFTVAEREENDELTGATGYPTNDFFEPGKQLRVQVRFANLTKTDDAALDVRGCAIKFSDHRSESPLDLLMNTGTYCPAYNLVTFASFVASKFLPVSLVKAAVSRNPVAREGGIAGLRRAPDSYARLHYYGQIVRHWIDNRGVRHLVRYRCIPDTPAAESGLPSVEDAAKVWLRDRRSDEDRPANYLRREIEKRVEDDGVRMRLQAQYRRPQPGDSDDWYNAAVEWDERLCPWVDLGTFELDSVLSEADTELLMFNPGNHPMTLGIPRSRSPFDYRSMGDSEARVVRALQRFRLWITTLFGPPPTTAVEGTPGQSS